MTTNRPYNFSPGPATLPQEVLEKAQAELLSWQGRGVSIMEISHRSDAFMTFAASAEQDLRDLLAIPDHYQVLFMQGGGRAQFSMVPLNLLGNTSTPCADYFNMGIWSQLAIQEAKRYAKVNVVTSGAEASFTTIPDPATWQFMPESAYVHYVSNETINGIELHTVPDVGDSLLVSDMSSNLLSQPIDVQKFALIYACAQKNLGIAGLTVVIIRNDLLDRVRSLTPTLYQYRSYATTHSMCNTPPVFSWYIAGLVFKWIKQQGGLSSMANINQDKANQLYEYIDATPFYQNNIDIRYRSRMNIIFTLTDVSLTDKFLLEAESAQLYGLKGHKLLGGIRASLYNAMPKSGVEALITFMQDFARRHSTLQIRSRS